MVTHARRSRRRGVTLVDVAAAVAVLAVVAVSASSAGPAQLRGIARTHQEDAALHAATARFERLRAPGANLVAGVREFVPDGALGAELPQAAGVETIDPAGPGLVRATVQVEWDAADGGRERLRLVTLVAAEASR